MIGTLIGASLGSIIGIGSKELIDSYIENKEYENFQNWLNDPSTEEFLYNDEGEKLWSNKKGCIGPATYIE